MVKRNLGTLALSIVLGSIYSTPIFAVNSSEKSPPLTSSLAKGKKPTAKQAPAQSNAFLDWLRGLSDEKKQAKGTQSNSDKNTDKGNRAEETNDPKGPRVALWVKGNPSDKGHVEWVNRSSCTPLYTDNSLFMVTDLWDKNNTGYYESLRTTGKYRKDNANLKGLIPKGSLVMMTNHSSGKYEWVYLISIGELDGTVKPEQIAKPQDQGFLFGASLMNLAGYYVTLAPGENVELAKSQGLDLSNISLRPVRERPSRQYRDEVYAGLSCKVKVNGTMQVHKFMLFNAHQGDNDTENFLLGVSPSFSRIFDTAMAYPDDDLEDIGDEGGDGDGDGGGQADDGSSATSGQAGAVNAIGGVPVVDNSRQDVICFDFKANSVAVRGENKKDKTKPGDVVFKVTENGAGVKIVQDFSGIKPRLEVSGKMRTYVKVEIIGRKKPNVGLVSDEFVAKRSQCKSLPENADLNDLAGGGKAQTGTAGTSANAVANGSGPSNTANHGNPRGAITKPVITDVNLFLFPLLNKAARGYQRDAQGDKRYFGAPRKGGRRTHAGCDLLSPRGKVVRAVSDGEILLDPYVFYRGGKGKGPRKSYAIEQKLANGMIARYGEVGYTDEIKKGSVNMDQALGIVSFTRMLHFELYAGDLYDGKNGKIKKGTGLTVRGTKYSRRKDLVDPTPFLLRWEERTFKGQASGS